MKCDSQVRLFPLKEKRLRAAHILKCYRVGLSLIDDDDDDEKMTMTMTEKLSFR